MDVNQHDRRPLNGLTVAGLTALISGASVFVNSYGVHDFSSPLLYTTGKNLVAAMVLLVGTVAVVRLRPDGGRTQPYAPAVTNRVKCWRVLGLAYVGIVGGGFAFVLFFDGLAQTPAAPAAFLHDTLVIFVALLAWPVLVEKISRYNLLAIGFLVTGEVVISGGIGHIALGRGPLLVLGATALWAVETVLVKNLLVSTSSAHIGLVRMGVGSLFLVGDLGVTGHLAGLGTLDRAQVGWILITGLLLAGYVATWFTALARARAIDVTSVLVASVVVTSLLQEIADRSLPASTYLGIGLVAFGLVALPKSRVRSLS